MRKFITPVAMPVNLKQYLAMKPEMEKLGYIPYQMDTQFIDEYYFLSNSWAQNNERTQHYFFVQERSNKVPLDPSENYNGAIFIDYNPDLFLALAAMSDSKFGGIGEYWVFKGCAHEPFTNGGLYKQINEDTRKPLAFLDDIGSKNGYSGGGECPPSLEKFRKATIEEILNHFSKEEDQKRADWETLSKKVPSIKAEVPDFINRQEKSFFDQISGESDKHDEPEVWTPQFGEKVIGTLQNGKQCIGKYIEKSSVWIHHYIEEPNLDYQEVKWCVHVEKWYQVELSVSELVAFYSQHTGIDLQLIKVEK